ncbi:hypothetical protein FPV16_25530 [Methylobacterium sp. W2]|uniref:hypothetical protein n=1 Tax=Methylobacterium sp. W2 TaxID=2598107 RepID=UPI001D0CD129|nr:hypothetical protein [Methylobacterium sp. W2]MCC0809520.1 hypothetical protein [Methylobacterium sp. W2]
MISDKTTDSLVRMASAGASLKVDGEKFIPDSLVRIASSLQPGAHLEICNSKKLTTDSCVRIASAGGDGGVLFS